MIDTYVVIEIGTDSHFVVFHLPASMAQYLSDDDADHFEEIALEILEKHGMMRKFSYFEADIRVYQRADHYWMNYNCDQGEGDEYTGSGEMQKRGRRLPAWGDNALDLLKHLLHDLITQVMDDRRDAIGDADDDDGDESFGPTVVASSALDEELALDTPDRQKLGQVVDALLGQLDPLPRDDRHPR